MSQFLKYQMFHGFSAPKKDVRRLTFNKGCRLTDVVLTSDGIVAWGHLWELSHVIDTARFPQELPLIDEPSGRLALKQRKRLFQLVFHLRKMGHISYADRIDKYLATDSNAGNSNDSSTKRYLHRMAVELAGTIEAGRKLRLGSIWDPTGRSAPDYAVSVWHGEDGDMAFPPAPAFVFTSAWQGDPGSGAHDANDIDRHVSLRVNLEDPISGGVPHLRIRNWQLGMCFFDGCPRTRVVFPWPRALEEIGHRGAA